jgi:hypothetical protein
MRKTYEVSPFTVRTTAVWPLRGVGVAFVVPVPFPESRQPTPSAEAPSVRKVQAVPVHSPARSPKSVTCATSTEASVRSWPTPATTSRVTPPRA